MQHDHRYAMVWPSEVPDDGGKMLVYKWLDGDGNECDPPTYADLAELPKLWVDHLTGSRPQAAARKTGTNVGKRIVASHVSAQDGGDGEGIEQFKADMFAFEADMSSQMEQALDEALVTWGTLKKGSHHDSMVSALRRVLLEGCLLYTSDAADE